MLHHLDVHVSDLGAASRLFDAVATAVGYRRLPPDPQEPDCIAYETVDGGRPRIGFIQDGELKAGAMRIAFAALGRPAVDRAANDARAAGALMIEGPGLHPEYGPDFYAVFYEDGDGNRFEIVAI